MGNIALSRLLGLDVNWLCFELVCILLQVSNTSQAGLCSSDLRTAGQQAVLLMTFGMTR